MTKEERYAIWSRYYQKHKTEINARRKVVRESYKNKLSEAENKIAELEAQIEKLIDFVISKTECCDVCPITDTCINSEGTCPYAGILAKGEEEVTKED